MGFFKENGSAKGIIRPFLKWADASVLRTVFPSPTPPTLILSEIILTERIIILSSLLYLLSKCIIKHQEFNDIQAAIST